MAGGWRGWSDATSHHFRRGVSADIVIDDSSAGTTLIELLVALVIASLIVGIVGYTYQYEITSWNRITAHEAVQAGAEYAYQRLGTIIPNLSGPTVQSNELSGTDMNYPQDIVKIVVTNNPIDPGNMAIVATWYDSTNPAVPLANPAPVSIQFVQSTFQGTTFAVNGSVVQVMIQCTDANDGTTSIALPSEFLTGGG